MPDSKIHFASLGSGSKGNATLVRCESTCVMVDCGFSVRETEQRMQKLSLEAGDLTAILLTHEHSDHISGVGALSRKYNLPVYLSYGTLQSERLGELPNANIVTGDHTFSIDALNIKPFSVPHDAREPVQYVFSNGNHQFAVLTDVGHITQHIVNILDGCDALLLECNHDMDMLKNGRYPESLKRRVAGNLGHLNNQQSAGLLRQIDCTRLQHLIAAHISEKNNTPYHAQTALAEVFACLPEEIRVADQETGLDWHRLQ